MELVVLTLAMHLARSEADGINSSRYFMGNIIGVENGETSIRQSQIRLGGQLVDGIIASSSCLINKPTKLQIYDTALQREGLLTH